MLIFFLTTCLFLGVALAAGVVSCSYSWSISRSQTATERPRDASCYLPMIRLLQEPADENTASRAERAHLRAERRATFRKYLELLGEDYGRTAAAVRLAMAQSAEDRPDLANALLKNRLRFILTLCRIDLSLRLHALGIGSLQVSRPVRSAELLRRQVAALADSVAWGS
jgi:hypothetical protein